MGDVAGGECVDGKRRAEEDMTDRRGVCWPGTQHDNLVRFHAFILMVNRRWGPLVSPLCCHLRSNSIFNLQIPSLRFLSPLLSPLSLASLALSLSLYLSPVVGHAARMNLYSPNSLETPPFN